MCFFLFKGRAPIKPPSLPLPCIPAGMSHLALLKAHAGCKLFPPNIQLREVVIPKFTLTNPRVVFLVLSFSRGSFHNTAVNMKKRNWHWANELFEFTGTDDGFWAGAVTRWRRVKNIKSQMFVCYREGKQRDGRTHQRLDLNLLFL